ncbi:MAG: glycosyltransferase [Sandaracinaceae bacterium]|nr:glycosyltransferase [Sandaracinaceae bacterium]
MLGSVCYFGTYESDYDRNRILQEALRLQGIRVLTCHEPVLEARRHKTGTLGSPAGVLGLGLQMARAWARLATRYLAMEDHDAVVVGYLGHLDVLLAAPLARLRGKPVIFDAFISLYDTLVHDRAVFAEGSLGARAAKGLDRLACSLSDVVLLDTEAHAAFFVEELGAPEGRCLRVLVGADPTRFHPVEPAPRERFTVLQYSKLAPLHGIRSILEAAKRLEGEPDIRFLIVGEGQLNDQVDAWMRELAPSNVERRAWMEGEALRTEIASAGACLGIFGDTAKAARVIPNKLYQCMAIGAPIVTQDSPGARELLVDGRDALLCPAADGAALADAILRLRDDPALRASLARNARARFQERCTPRHIGEELVRDLDQALFRGAPRYRRPGGTASGRPSATTDAPPRSRTS